MAPPPDRTKIETRGGSTDARSESPSDERHRRATAEAIDRRPIPPVRRPAGGATGVEIHTPATIPLPTLRIIRAGGPAAHHGRPASAPLGHTLARSTPLIRVALVVEPPVLRDVLREILASAPDVELVSPASPAPPAGVAGNGAAEVVILTAPHPENELIPALMLFQEPRSRVLALSGDARQAFLYELRPHRTALGELSRERLLEAVRAAAGGERA